MYVKQKEQCGSHTRHDLITYEARSYHIRGTILSWTGHDVTQTRNDRDTGVAGSYHGRGTIEPLDKRLLVVILLPLEDGAGTVELFYEDQTYHLMGEGHAGKRDHGLSPFVHRLRESVWSSDDKDKVAPGSLSLTKPSGELDAAALLATLVKEDETVLGLHLI